MIIMFTGGNADDYDDAVAIMFNLPVPIVDEAGKAFVAVIGILETKQQHLRCFLLH